MQPVGVDICIPWRAAPERIPAYERVIEFWEYFATSYPGPEPLIHLGDSPRKRQPFSIAQARNAAVKRSAAEVVIVADADTVPDMGNVYRAIEMAATERVVVWPFQQYRHIPADAASSDSLHGVPADHTYRASVGGLFVVSRDLYSELGEQDERFEPRWGYDDSAFHLVARTLARVARTDGVVYSFNHPADRDMTDANPNKHRYELYKFANGQPEVMRELIK